MLRDVNGTDTSTTFLGRKIAMPVALAPIGSIERFDAAACAAVADAAGTFGCPMFQSSVAKPDIEDTGKVVPNGLKIFQLYVRGDQAWVEAIFDRAVKAGFGALCLTVDTHHYSRRERDISKRYHAASSRDPDASRHQKALDWAQVDKVKKKYKLPIVIKGIATAEDAKLAVEHGVDVIYVSNHGGRQLDHGAGAIDVLPEIVAAAKGKASIIIDGSFCRGTDVVKAIALGADLVCIGRLYAFGMAAAGRDGIFRVLELLHDEMTRAMGLMGVNTLARAQPVLPARRAAGAAAARAERVPLHRRAGGGSSLLIDHAWRKQILELRQLRRQPLLQRILRDGFEHLAVCRHAVRDQRRGERLLRLPPAARRSRNNIPQCSTRRRSLAPPPA